MEKSPAAAMAAPQWNLFPTPKLWIWYPTSLQGALSLELPCAVGPDVNPVLLGAGVTVCGLHVPA